MTRWPGQGERRCSARKARGSVGGKMKKGNATRVSDDDIAWPPASNCELISMSTQQKPGQFDQGQIGTGAVRLQHPRRDLFQSIAVAASFSQWNGVKKENRADISGVHQIVDYIDNILTQCTTSSRHRQGFSARKRLSTHKRQLSRSYESCRGVRGVVLMKCAVDLIPR